MKIAILARGASRPGGVSRLIKGYVRALPEAAPDDEFFVLTDCALGGTPRANVKEIKLAPAHPAVFDHVLVPRAVRRLKPDVFLATKNTTPLGLTCPTVCMVLDLAYFAMPAAYPTPDNVYARMMLRRSAKAAARIVAISAATREDIGKYLSSEAYDRTRVVYPGLEAAFRKLSDDEKLAAAGRLPGLPERFVFYAGNISPRKNLARLAAAMDPLEGDVGLVITGHRSWKSGSLWAAFAAARAKRQLLILGPRSDSDVIALYNLAAAAAYPSLYEGFGFPILESFACGTPLVASRAASVAEVAGDAALLVDALDAAAIGVGLRRILSDDALRADLTERGRARVAEFTWERAAREMLATLKEIA